MTLAPVCKGQSPTDISIVTADIGICYHIYIAICIYVAIKTTCKCNNYNAEKDAYDL